MKHSPLPEVKPTQGQRNRANVTDVVLLEQNFGVLWKQRGLLTSAGTSGYNSECLDALLLPVEMAMIKVEAYKREIIWKLKEML